MSKLTDLEIVTKIARIEFDDLINCYLHEFDGICIDKPMCGMVFREAYNPLTDDALCFKLMIKYQVSTCFVRPAGSYIGNGADFTFKGNPNKAICMAIIEAHK